MMDLNERAYTIDVYEKEVLVDDDCNANTPEKSMVVKVEKSEYNEILKPKLE